MICVHLEGEFVYKYFDDQICRKDFSRHYELLERRERCETERCFDASSLTYTKRCHGAQSGDDHSSHLMTSSTRECLSSYLICDAS